MWNPHRGNLWEIKEMYNNNYQQGVVHYPHHPVAVPGPPVRGRDMLVVIFVVIPARAGTSTNFKSFWRRFFVWKITLWIKGLILLIF